jgi:hypothetical protein
VENHLVRKGMADLVTRLKAGGREGDIGSSDRSSLGDADAEDTEVRFLRAVSQLRDMAELGPERDRAAERHKHEASEESWDAYHRLRGYE